MMPGMDMRSWAMRHVVKALDWQSEDDVEHLLITYGQTADQVFSGFAWLLTRLKERDTDWQKSDDAVRLAKASLERTIQLLSEATGTDIEDVTLTFTAAFAEIQKAQIQKKEWKWPVVNESPGQRGGAGEYREFSALKLFGYTVGKTAGWPEHQRRVFLADFMRHDLPPIVEELFPGEYGRPMSAHRLRKVATHIASVCSSASKRDALSNAHAIIDWHADLAFLKSEFYEREGLKFQPWPDPYEP